MTVPAGTIGRIFGIAALIAVFLAAPVPASAAGSRCAVAVLVLWGDGRHDDTRALNAWFRGEPVVWAQTGRTVGTRIAGHLFRLSSTVYMPSGTGRTLEDFAMLWPAQREHVSGGTIDTGNDPDRVDITRNLVKIGAAPDDGVPFAAPPPQPGAEKAPSNCLIS